MNLITLTAVMALAACVVLVSLKMAQVVTWPWLVILSPLWLWIGLAIVGAILLAAYLAYEWVEWHNPFE